MELAKGPLRDFLLFVSVTIGFHFLYWNTNMNQWLFGIYSKDVFDFFTRIAFKGTAILSDLFIGKDFDKEGLSLSFYDINSLGTKDYICKMKIVEDCSGIKQIFQVLLIMLVAPNKLWKRLLYFLISIPVVIFFNIVRISSLTAILVYYPNHYTFIHDWIGRPFHYVIIFFIWIIWMEFFARDKEKVKIKKESC